MCKYGGRGSGGAWRGLQGRVTPSAGLNVPLLSCSDPDNVAFCVLAADEEDEGDIALQIHFTLIQAFCCENDIDIVRVNDVAKLAAIVGPSEESGEPRDLHCILITVSVLRDEGADRSSGRRGCAFAAGLSAWDSQSLSGWTHLPLVVRSSSEQREGAWHTLYSKSAE